MRLCPYICILLFLTSACSSTADLASAVDASPPIDDGTVCLKSGEVYQAEDIRVARDSTSFIDRATNTHLRLPNQDISSVQTVNRFVGAMEGLFYGGLAGGALGLALVSGKSDDGTHGGKGLAIFGGAVFAGTIGLVFGIIKGHDDTYVFSHDTLAIEMKLIQHVNKRTR